MHKIWRCTKQTTKLSLDGMSDEFNGWTFTCYNLDEIKLQNHIDHKLTRLWNWWHYILVPHRWIHVHKIYRKDEMKFKHKNHNIYEVVNMDLEIQCLICNSIILLEFQNMDEWVYIYIYNLYFIFEVYKFRVMRINLRGRC
jgi:hypothetical protein